MPLQFPVSDPVIIAMLALVGPFLGAFATWITVRHTSSDKSVEQHQLGASSLNTSIDKRIELILNERDETIKDLRVEVANVNVRLRDIHGILQTLVMAGAQCDRHVSGDCPIRAAGVSAKLRDFS